MGRGLKYDIPGKDWRCSAGQIAGEGWQAAFAPELLPPLHLVVEIGFGRGEFLLALAEENPGVAFVGVEVSFKRVLKMARKVARAGLQNIRLIEGQGQVLVSELLEEASVQEFWINFSDPWPKARHARRRLSGRHDCLGDDHLPAWLRGLLRPRRVVHRRSRCGLPGRLLRAVRHRLPPGRRPL